MLVGSVLGVLSEYRIAVMDLTPFFWNTRTCVVDSASIVRLNDIKNPYFVSLQVTVQKTVEEEGFVTTKRVPDGFVGRGVKGLETYPEAQEVIKRFTSKPFTCYVGEPSTDKVVLERSLFTRSVILLFVLIFFASGVVVTTLITLNPKCFYTFKIRKPWGRLGGKKTEIFPTIHTDADARARNQAFLGILVAFGVMPPYFVFSSKPIYPVTDPLLWETVEVTIIQSELLRGTERGRRARHYCYPDIVYEYTLNGKTFTSGNLGTPKNRAPSAISDTCGWTRTILGNYPKGARVNASVNKGDPSLSILKVSEPSDYEAPSPLGLILLLIGVGGLIYAAYHLSPHFQRARKTKLP
jgi:Protein of unknown function (DUF3592)